MAYSNFTAPAAPIFAPDPATGMARWVPPYAYPQPQVNNQSGINWVQGDAGAKAFLVQPGATVFLMDSEGDFFYIKSADNAGMPSLRKFAYEEIVEGKVEEKNPEYITRDEFERKIAELSKQRYNKNYDRKDRNNE